MLKSGDKLRVRTIMIVRETGFTFHPGDVFTLIEPTGMAPYGHQSKICNWLVDAPNGVSVWSSIWMALEYGWLEKIPNER